MVILYLDNFLSKCNSQMVKKNEDYEYWKHPEKGYPKTIWWNVLAGPNNLSMLQDHDIVFDAYDLKIRKIERVLNDHSK